jgi:hypothetical protein
VCYQAKLSQFAVVSNWKSQFLDLSCTFVQAEIKWSHVELGWLSPSICFWFLTTCYFAGYSKGAEARAICDP